MTPDHIRPILSADELHKIIKTGQNGRLAWLKDVSDNVKLSETLTAMANAQGGQLIIGIHNADDPPQGITSPTESINIITQTALSLTPPLIIPFPSLLLVEDKHLILIEIPNGMPYIYTFDGRYLIREGDQNIPLSAVALHQLMIERGDISFETEPAFRTTLDSLNWEKVNEYARLLRTAEKDVKQLLYKRGCLVKSGEDYIPTNAGILLFGKDPTPHIFGAEITAVRFAGESMSDTFRTSQGHYPIKSAVPKHFSLTTCEKGLRSKRRWHAQNILNIP
jgi:ATP-dependent DNA helicase RecG